LAENISTFANIWHYPNQLDAWRMASIQKLSAWFLLMIMIMSMIMSFVMVSWLHLQRETQRSTSVAVNLGTPSPTD
jgi:uncharacterized membrane protein YoaT (DUF817 family)